MTFGELRERENRDYLARAEKNEFTLRVHRAISWGVHAEESLALDDKFIFYWISFNAIYGNSIADSNVADDMHAFFYKICNNDKDNAISTTLVSLGNAIRGLLDNKYLYRAYWAECIDRDKTEEEFAKKHSKIKKATYEALTNKVNQTETLMYIFDLINLLRNQIFHGSATFNGRVNRSQVEQASGVLARLLPIIVEILYDNPNDDWGTVSYPVVEG